MRDRVGRKIEEGSHVVTYVYPQAAPTVYEVEQVTHGGRVLLRGGPAVCPRDCTIVRLHLIPEVLEGFIRGGEAE